VSRRSNSHPWGLAEARVAAACTLASPRPRQAVTALIRSCHARDAFTRQQAADTLRRLAEKSEGRALVQLHADRIIDALSLALSAPATEPENWRTRSHLLIAAAHAARTRSQRQRAADLAFAQINASENVVRACAIESLGLLAQHEASFRETLEPMLLERLAAGTPAERVRARDALRRLGTSVG
jgi:hypothetical protein